MPFSQFSQIPRSLCFRIIFLAVVAVLLLAGAWMDIGSANAKVSFTETVSDGTLRPAAGPLTLAVNSLADSADTNVGDGLCDTDAATPGEQCTLRAAIQETNSATTDTDVINFSLPANSTIALDTALPTISGHLTINGPGADQLTVMRSAAAGTPNFRIFTIGGAMVTNVGITGLGIANGNVIEPNNGGGILNNVTGSLTLTACNLYGNKSSSPASISNGWGGAIYNQGGLSLNNSNIGGLAPGQGNTATSGGGGIWSENGSLTMSGGSIVGNSFTGIILKNGFATLNGVAIDGNASGSLSGAGVAVLAGGMVIQNCLISNNTTTTGGGAGIFNNGGLVTVTSSTISGNSTSLGSAGGVDGSLGEVRLNNVTITNNRAAAFGGGIAVRGNTTVILRNTIVAGNFRGASPSTTADDIFGNVNSGSSSNLIGTGGTGGLTNGSNGNQVGVANPMIAPLASNGGPTLTHALLPGSPALDMGNNSAVVTPTYPGPPFTDQRGTAFNRIVDGPDPDTTATIDVGAYETQPSLEALSEISSFEDRSVIVPFDLGDTSSITSMSATSSDSTLVPNQPSNINVTASGSTGILTINPATNLFGTTDITVTINRTSGASSRTFALNLTSVNDAPSFTKGAGQTVNNNAGAQTVANWATNILAGPANESGQTLSFQINGNTFPGLFTTAPAVSSTGTLTFTPAANAGGTSTITIRLQDNGGTANGGVNNSLTQTFTITIVPAGGFIALSATNYDTTESSGFTTVTINRTGDLTKAVTVDYRTNDFNNFACSTTSGVATPKCDFTTAIGTLNFAAGENSKTVNILISQDVFVEGPETFSISLLNPTNNAAVNSSASISIADDVTEPATNPIDDVRNFVRQHYHDFLGREPDASGWDFWTNQITSCGNDVQCNEVRRIDVSASFFLSIEFQQSGYLVERFYKVGFGDTTGTSRFGSTHQIPVPILQYNEFVRDTRRIGEGVIVLQPGWEQVLENNKQAYALEFVQATRFSSFLSTSLTPTAFVDRLNLNSGGVLSASERQTAIDLFGGAANSSNVTARAQAVRMVAEDTDLYNAEYNRAFVLAEYFGYLRRNPIESPDSDYTGYDFWLTKLNQFNGNYINAEMVKAFLSSIEYRQRFGP